MSKNKKFILSIIGLSGIIFVTFCYSYYKNHSIQAICEAAMVLIFMILFLFLKNKELCTSYSLIIFAVVNILFDPTAGYGAITTFCLVCIYHKTLTKILGPVSLICSIASIIIHKHPIEKSIILVISGLIAYITILNVNKYKLTHKKLDLTPDEIKILDELQEVKLQKSVKCFSKNTVSKKLTEATERNKLSSIGELTYCYKLQSD